MDFFIKLLLVLIYPLLLLGRLLNGLMGRDPLRLREPEGSCWIERAPSTDRSAYFSEASPQEGHAHGGQGGLAVATLVFASRLAAPPRQAQGEAYRAAAERDQSIPDEVYTLW